MAERNIQIGQLLLQDQLITPEQLDQALGIQKKTSEKLGDILTRLEFISEEDFTRTLAKRLKTTFIDLNMVKVDAAAARLVPEEYARKNCLIAIEKKDGALTVAMKDPMNYYIIEDLRFMTNLDIKTVVAMPTAIYQAIDGCYIGSAASEIAQDVNKEFVSVSTASELAAIGSEINERVDGAPVVRLVNSLMLQAVKSGASDIHIEPGRGETKVRLRIDGHLREVLRLGAAAHASVLTRLKIMSSMNIAERRLPLDGRCEVDLEGQKIDMRVSTLPTVYGEKAVIRLLTNSFTSNLTNKQALGLSDRNLRMFDELIRSSHGIILVTGPTGSGKTTTLYTILNEIMSPEINIVTIEDPVEFKVDGANQMQINVKAGLTFASGLRSILRQDPDVIMIGEIRDTETAAIAVRAAITGHLVLSTLHTNDAVTTIGRLVDMEIKPYLVASAVNGVIAQRLVRKICPVCKVAYESTDSENAILGLSHSRTLHKGAGCVNCSFTGYKGRTAIHEILLMDDTLRGMIVRDESSTAMEEYAISQGMITLKEDVKALVFGGISTVSELIQATYTL